MLLPYVTLFSLQRTWFGIQIYYRLFLTLKISRLYAVLYLIKMDIFMHICIYSLDWRVNLNNIHFVQSITCVTVPSVTTGSNVNPNKTCKSFFKISPSFLRQNLVLQVSANSMWDLVKTKFFVSGLETDTEVLNENKSWFIYFM